MKSKHPSPLLHAVCALAAWASFVVSTPALTNLVHNGSFEDFDSGWASPNGLQVYRDQGAADGSTHIAVVDYLWQDVSTVPGRDYVLSFAVRDTLTFPPVTWGGISQGPFTNYANSGLFWNYGYCYVHAEGSITRLRFDGGMIDDVRVGWVNEPIRLLTQPQSRSAFDGGNVSFSVRADGAPPLNYQWRFNGTPIPGAVSGALTLVGLRPSQAGRYSVVVSNSWSVAVSDGADLGVVAPPTSPIILAEPVGDISPMGYGCSLHVLAVGELPLSYQWSLGGAPLPGATNASLVFEAVQLSDSGTYSARVSNSRGTVVSLPAVLTVTNAPGGGYVVLDTMTNNAPIYDVDGTTRLGSAFVAQLYAGSTPEILRPVGAPIPFWDGDLAGYVVNSPYEIPNVISGDTSYVQIRAWEAASGSTYEAARASGGKFGFSGAYEFRTGNFFDRIPMKSFSLRSGEPFFVTGRLNVGELLPDHSLQFVLTGEPGARYLIEARQPPDNWIPLLILTNTTGTSTFSDTGTTQHPVQFYRARILD